VDVVLASLDNPRRSGKGWTARCPAHDDKGPSLSINEGDDGRVLLHCFAGCSTAEVVSAVGLTLSDLFERPDWKSEAWNLRRLNARRVCREADWAAALNVLAIEAAIVEIAATETAAGFDLSSVDMDRLAVAIRRVRDARKVLSDRQ
jgi:hypothetical protein